MNFGQALMALLNGKNISADELGHSGAYLALQNPAGNVTERFIAMHRANGVCIPWTPTQEAILATSWRTVEGEGSVAAGTGQTEHAGIRG